MKVLHFKTTYLNLSEIFIDRLVSNHQNVEPIVATCNKRYYTEDCTIFEMPDHGIKGMYNKFLLALNRSPDFLYKVFDKVKPDVVHGHFGLDSYRLLNVCEAKNVPLICNFYGYDVTRLPNEWGWKHRYKILNNKASWFIGGSKDIKKNLIKLGFPKEKIAIIKLGMDIQSINYQHRKKSGLNLMIVGRLVEKKGIKYALKAINLLKNEFTEIRLDIYGDGVLRKQLENLVSSLQLQNNVRFCGMVENEKVFEELYNHDMLLVPSVSAKDGDREGIPQTTVEGMATGIPVIASNHAGLPELVKNEDTGLQVQERNEHEIATAIKKLITLPELVQKISQQGRQKVLEEHDIHKQVRKTENLYHKVINQFSA